MNIWYIIIAWQVFKGKYRFTLVNLYFKWFNFWVCYEPEVRFKKVLDVFMFKKQVRYLQRLIHSTHFTWVTIVVPDVALDAGHYVVEKQVAPLLDELIL